MTTTLRGGLFAVCVLLASAVPSPAAQEPAAGGGDDANSSTTPRGRSSQQVLLQDPLHVSPGKVAHVLRIEYPAGWVGRRHYHTGDVFVYVLEGGFTILRDGQSPVTLGPGEIFHEAVNEEMQARNASTAEPTTILLFQIGDEGQRTTVVTD